MRFLRDGRTPRDSTDTSTSRVFKFGLGSKQIFTNYALQSFANLVSVAFLSVLNTLHSEVPDDVHAILSYRFVFCFNFPINSSANSPIRAVVSVFGDLVYEAVSATVTSFALNTPWCTCDDFLVFMIIAWHLTVPYSERFTSHNF